MLKYGEKVIIKLDHTILNHDTAIILLETLNTIPLQQTEKKHTLTTFIKSDPYNFKI